MIMFRGGKAGGLHFVDVTRILHDFMDIAPHLPTKE
jgi:hypothetical protein